MCGIIGFSSNNVTEKDIEVLKKVMIESRIRGKHASGIAWYNGKTILSVVVPMPIDTLVSEFDFNVLVRNKRVAMIAHARYSTSDIRFNQPIVGEHFAVAHNGVITQSDPKTWGKTYGYKCNTQNDSELLLRALENNDNPLDVFEDSSIAAVVLNDKGELIYMRNGARPLWMGKIGEGNVYASTYDILKRAGVKGISKISPSDYKELQRRNITQWEKK